MSDTKRWMPYRSLSAQDFNKKNEEKPVEKPTISTEVADKINYYLNNYQDKTLKIKYYKSGKIYELECQIKKVDEIEKTIKTTENKTLNIKDIIDIDKA